MQFDDSSTLQGLKQDIDFLCGTNDTAYTENDKVRNINRWAYRVVTWIYRASGTWQFDDSNKTDFPIATTTLVASQQDYELPSDLLKIERVEVLDSDGNYRKLKAIDQSQIDQALTEFKESDGLPQYYDLVGNSLFLYPAPAAADVTTSAGLKIHFLREIDVFTGSDTTQEPGFAEPFHRLLSLGAAYDWLVANGTQQRLQNVRQEIEIMREELAAFYKDRNRDVKIQVKPGHRQLNYL